MISLSSVLICVLSLIVAFFVGQWLFKKDTELENKRRAAGELAGILRSYGLIELPKLLVDFSVGDLSGMFERAKQVVELFDRAPAAVTREFDQIFARVLDQKLKTLEGRTMLAAKLADAVQPDDPKTLQNA